MKKSLNVKFGFIRLHKFLSGKNGQTEMYSLTPTIFFGLMDDHSEKDWMIGIEWLLWTVYVQIGKLKK